MGRYFFYYWLFFSIDSVVYVLYYRFQEVSGYYMLGLSSKIQSKKEYAIDFNIYIERAILNGIKDNNCNLRDYLIFKQLSKGEK